MTTTTLVRKSKKYPDITYDFCASSFEPDKGYLNYVLLRHNVRVSALIFNQNQISEYKYANIMVAYKTVKSRQARKQKIESLLYRETIDTDISTILQTKNFKNFAETKILLLNDILLDKFVGDAGLQIMFRFEKHDGTSEFFLSPGSAIKQLTDVIGFSIFEAESVDAVLSDITCELLDLIYTEILPNSKIMTTDKLKEDISKYLTFCLIGK